MIDPHIQGLLNAMAESGFALPDPVTPEALRAVLDAPIPGAPVDIAERRDVMIKLDGRSLKGRLYHPDPTKVLPIALFFHGGGWVHGTLDMFDRLCATLAGQANCAFLFVDYRLAPENPFPAAYNDALESLQWVKDNHTLLSVDATRIALTGDSAGGNLAASVAQTVSEDAAIIHQLLLYPALDGRCGTASFNGDHAGFLSASQMRWYWDQYASADVREDARVSPVLGEIKKSLAPATIIVAGNDPLHDEGVNYAAALKAAGVETELHDYPGAIHGFVSLFGMVPLADEAVAVCVDALKTAFAKS